MAPMVAQSDLAFRTLCRRYGTELCYTQMIHSSNFCKSVIFQDNHLDVYRNDGSEGVVLSDSGKTVLNGLKDWGGGGDNGMEQRYNDLVRGRTDADDDGRWTSYSEGDDTNPVLPVGTTQRRRRRRNPLIVQLAGNDPQTMSRAAMTILHRTNTNTSTNTNTNTNADYNYDGAVSGIDINCGCPQGIARKGRYGAFLMEEDNGALVCNIITRMKKDLPRNVGVSVKIRIPSLEEEEMGRGIHGDDTVLKDRICRLIDAG